MFFRKEYEARVGKNEMIMSELLSNAFRSVQHQVKAPPLCNCLYSSANKGRCRLNLYAMNIGILDYILVSNLKTNAKLYVGTLQKQLVETICHADPYVVENVEFLILDKNLIASLVDRTMNDLKFKILSKKGLLNGYILNRIKEYNYAINLKLKLMSKSDLNTVKPYLLEYPVTKVFSQDFLGADYKSSSDFSISFAHNISIKSLNLFSAVVDEILS